MTGLSVIMFAALLLTFLLTGVVHCLESRISSSSRVLQIKSYLGGLWENVCFEDSITIATAVHMCTESFNIAKMPVIYEYRDSARYSAYTIDCNSVTCRYRLRNGTTCSFSVKMFCNNKVQFNRVIGAALLQQIYPILRLHVICYEESYSRQDLQQLCYDMNNSTTQFTATMDYYTSNYSTAMRMECSHANGRRVCGFRRPSATYCTRALVLMCAHTEPVYKLEPRGSTVDGILYTWLSTYWGTVCSNTFGQQEATVACRGLGYNGVETFSPVSSTERPALLSVTCNGTESNLHMCERQLWLPFTCHPKEVVRLSCTPGIYNTELRLAGGATSGLLKAWAMDSWKMYCFYKFVKEMAGPVCKALGYSEKHAHVRPFDLGHSRSLVYGRVCTRNDSSQYICGTFISIECSHALHITCRPQTSVPPSSSTRETGMLRLENSTYVPMIAYRNVLRPISYNSYITGYGRLACESMGLPSRFAVPQRLMTKKAPVHISCSFRLLTLHDCIPTRRAYGIAAVNLRCLRSGIDSVRLDENTLSHTIGVPQVRVGNSWFGVCFSKSGYVEENHIADLLCKEQTHGRYAADTALLFAYTGSTVQDMSHAVGLVCAANGTRVLDCDITQCQSSTEQRTLTCPSSYSQAHVMWRLQPRVDQAYDFLSGYLQVRLGGVWGYVCDDGFANAAKVACRTMNKPYAGAHAIDSAPPVRKPYVIWLDDVVCTGRERDLLGCSHTPIGKHDCMAGEEVFITCQDSIPAVTVRGAPFGTFTAIRLRGGYNASEGRVEVMIGGVWGTVCDDSFDNQDAQVICRNLGFPSKGAMQQMKQYFPASTGPIHLTDVNCYGSESYLSECRHRRIGSSLLCDHTEDAAVICGGAAIVSSSPPSAAIAIITAVIAVVIAFVITVVCVRKRRRARATAQRRQASSGAVPSGSQSVSGEDPPPNYSMYLRYDNGNGLMNMGFQSTDNPATPDSAGAPPKYEDLFPVMSPSDGESPENGVTPTSAPGDAAQASGLTTASNPADAADESGLNTSSIHCDAPHEGENTSVSVLCNGPTGIECTTTDVSDDVPSAPSDMSL